MRIDGTPVQAISAGFALQGNLAQGELSLTSPLGTTLALARWDAHGVEWTTGNETTKFDDLDALALRLTGTALPFAALMDWLQGIPSEAGGWRADLREYSQGRIHAQREQPGPAASLRIMLEP